MSKVKKKSGQNLLTAKAYNGRCILSWLSDCLLTALASHQNNEMLILTSDAMTLSPDLEGSHNHPRVSFFGAKFYQFTRSLSGDSVEYTYKTM